MLTNKSDDTIAINFILYAAISTIVFLYYNTI